MQRWLFVLFLIVAWGLMSCGGEVSAPDVESEPMETAVSEETEVEEAEGAEEETAVEPTSSDDSESEPAELVEEDFEIEYSLADVLGDNSPSLLTLAPPSGGEVGLGNEITVSFGTALSVDELLAEYSQMMSAMGFEDFEISSDPLTDPFTNFEGRAEGWLMRVRATPTPAGTLATVSLRQNWSDTPLPSEADIPLPADAILLALVEQLTINFEEGTIADHFALFQPPFEQNLAGDGWTLTEAVAGEEILGIVEPQYSLAYGRTAVNGSVDEVRIFFIDEQSVYVNGSYPSLAQAELQAYEVTYPEDETVTETAVDEPEETITIETSLPPLNPADYGGEFAIAGSGNMVVIDELNNQFLAAGYTGSPVLNLSNGTSAGIIQLCDGFATAMLASRPLDDSETEFCEFGGATVVSFVIARNPVVVIVNPANDWATNMTQDELMEALTTAETWSDVNSAWPAVPIERFLPGVDSFPYRQLVQLVFSGDDAALQAADNVSFSEDDNALLASIAGSEGGISVLSHSAYADERAVPTTAVSIDSIPPGSEGYIMDQPLILHTLSSELETKPQFAAYVNYVLVTGRPILAELGLALVDSATQAQNEALWLEFAGE